MSNEEEGEEEEEEEGVTLWLINNMSVAAIGWLQYCVLARGEGYPTVRVRVTYSIHR